jgi:hypothetical protein
MESLQPNLLLEMKHSDEHANFPPPPLFCFHASLIIRNILLYWHIAGSFLGVLLVKYIYLHVRQPNSLLPATNLSTVDKN